MLFDLDDTLRDWRAAIDTAIDALVTEAGLEPRDAMRDAVWAAIDEHCVAWRDGMVMDRAYWKLLYEGAHVLARVLPDGVHDIDELTTGFRQRLRPPLFADTEPALRALAARLPLGILSNNPRAGDAAERQGIAEYFDAVVGLDPIAGKPAREAFEKGCEAMGVEPAACAYVGDSYENDLVGATEAGLHSIWLDRDGFDYERPPGTYRITSLSEAWPLLEDLAQGSARR